MFFLKVTDLKNLASLYLNNNANEENCGALEVGPRHAAERPWETQVTCIDA